MPLPLPNLDTRRWADLVEEASALIPRYAPQWTDHNVHDPGITTIELLAWLVEQSIYRANRIPERHRRKFLALAGYSPTPPTPAEIILGLRVTSSAAAGLQLPAGVIFRTEGAAGRVPFRTREPLTLVAAQIAAVQVHDGSAFIDRTRWESEALSFPAFGSDPRASAHDDGPALYLGFDRAIPAHTPLSLHFALSDDSAGERARILEEASAQAAACAPQPPSLNCKPCPAVNDPDCATAAVRGRRVGRASQPFPPHHSARLVWEQLNADGWREVALVDDTTRSLTLSGIVRLELLPGISQQQVGMLSTPLYYLRARLIDGAFDSAPSLLLVEANAVTAVQAVPAAHTLRVASGVAAPTELPIGATRKLELEIDRFGVVRALSIAPQNDAAPGLLILRYTPPTAVSDGAITLGFDHLLESDARSTVLTGTGLPDQQGYLLPPPIAYGAATLWSIEDGAWKAWEVRADLDASTATDRHYTLDPTTGLVQFGDGRKGVVPPLGATIVVLFESTFAQDGNCAALQPWSLAPGLFNAALLGAAIPDVEQFVRVRNRLPANGGTAEETLSAAATRAAAALWAHERLLDLCSTSCATLDQLDATEVRARTAPVRAATTFDFERIALDVPGTRIRRARAWAGLDPNYPCLSVPGTVTLVIVPELPASRPEPSCGLLRAVRRYLYRRRVLCTRLVVVGPQYLEVSVSATVAAVRGADTTRVRNDIIAALNTYLHPLIGGADGLGWPFGRDVYRSELMAVIDSVTGVDHVTALTLAGNGEVATCTNLCLAETWLVTAAEHDIQVVRS